MAPKQVIKHFGSLTATARALQIKPPSVRQWVVNDAIPIDRQCQIEILTSGELVADRTLLGSTVRAAA